MKIGASNSWQTVWQNSDIKVEAVKRSDKDKDEKNRDPLVIDVDFEELLEKESPLHSHSADNCSTHSSFYNCKGVIYRVPKAIGTVLAIV